MMPAKGNGAGGCSTITVHSTPRKERWKLARRTKLNHLSSATIAALEQEHARKKYRKHKICDERFSFYCVPGLLELIFGDGYDPEGLPGIPLAIGRLAHLP